MNLRSGINRAFFIVGFATFLSFAFVLQAYSRFGPETKPFPWKQMLAWELTGWYLWILFLIPIRALAKHFPAGQVSWLKLAVIHIPTSIAFAAVHLLIQLSASWVIEDQSRPFVKALSEEHWFCWLYVFWRMLIYMASLVFVHAIEYRTRFRNAELKASQLESLLKRAGLEKIRRQLNPQFLYRTLDFIVTLIHKNSARAERAIARLGTFLRLSLETGGAQFVSLKQELEFVKSFIDIENIRLKRQISLTVQTDSQASNQIVPGLLLYHTVQVFLEKFPSVASRNLSIHLDVFVLQEKLNFDLQFESDSIEAEEHLLRLPITAAGDLLQRLYELKSQSRFHFRTANLIFSIKRSSINIHERAQGPDAETYFRSFEVQESSGVREFKKGESALRWLWIPAFWIVVGLYFAAREIHSLDSKIDWINHSLQFVLWGGWAAATPLVLRAAKRFSLERPHVLQSIVAHLALNTAVWFVITAFYLWVRWLLSTSTDYLQYFAEHVSNSRFAFSFLVYWILVATGIAIDRYQKYRSEELSNSQLQAGLFQAQLDVLKMQLHPHFLFNALNSISQLLHENVQSAEKMLLRLKKFLQLTLENTSIQQATLREELEYMKCYLEIQHMRFQDRLRVNMKIEPDTMNQLVPHLLWQPVVENAIRHGISRMNGPGVIEIVSRRNGDRLLLEVRDNGPGLPQARPLRQGIGLTTIRAILDSLYGSSHEFTIQNAPEGGMVASLNIPANGFLAKN